jgi:hypothetical protein
MRVESHDCIHVNAVEYVGMCVLIDRTLARTKRPKGCRLKGNLINRRLEAAFRAKSKRTAPSRDRNRDLRITCIAAIPRSTTELKKLVLVDDHQDITSM